MKLAGLILMAVVVMVICYFIMMGVASFRQGYSWREMDWDGSGITTIFDFFEASNIGKRESLDYGYPCVEYFSYKDGLPIKVSCPNFNEYYYINKDGGLSKIRHTKQEDKYITQ